MDQLIIGVALGLVSFLSSVLVLFRILLPILPRVPMSNRITPPKFTFRTLSLADEAHLYLAAIDILALVSFVWQVVAQQNKTAAYDPAIYGADAARLWFATTARQTCLCIVLVLAVIRIRRGHPVSFGKLHWLLVAPTVFIVVLSTAVAAAMGIVGVPSLFIGISIYSVVVALISAVALLVLVRTIVTVHRRLSVLEDTWPPEKEKRRGSFATADVEALKDGSSWITSHRSSVSRQNLVSSFAFSIPTAPQLSHISPSRDFRVPDGEIPFHREVLSASCLPKSSNDSWLTEPSVAMPPMSEWSFPVSYMASLVAQSHQILPESVLEPELRTSARPLDGFDLLEKGHNLDNLSSGTPVATSDAPTSVWRTLGWISVILLPNMLALPFSLASSLHPTSVPVPFFVLFIISIVVSSPLLALNIALHSQMPLPVTLFSAGDHQYGFPSLALPWFRSMSANQKGSSRAQTPTVVDSRRNGDIWLGRRKAVDGRSRIERIFALTVRVPKLTFMSNENIKELETSVPRSTQRDDLATGNSENSHSIIEQVGGTSRQRHLTHDDSSMPSIVTIQHGILTAQRQVSARAMTLQLSPSPGPGSVDIVKNQTPEPVTTQNQSPQHGLESSQSIEQLPARSTSRSFISPLPPTPEHLRAYRGHVRCPVPDTNQIDGLSAGMLPMLVPGLKISMGMIKENDEWTAGLHTVPVCCSDSPQMPTPLNIQVVNEKTTNDKNFARSIRKGLGSLGRSSVVSTLRRSIPISLSSPENHTALPPPPPPPPPPPHMQSQRFIRKDSRSMPFQHNLFPVSEGASVVSETATEPNTGINSLRLVVSTAVKGTIQRHRSNPASDAFTGPHLSLSRSKSPVPRSHPPALLSKLVTSPAGMHPSGLFATPPKTFSTSSTSRICPDSPPSRDDTSVYSRRYIPSHGVATQHIPRIPDENSLSIGSSASPSDDTLSAAGVSVTSSNSGDSPEEWMRKKLRPLQLLHDHDSNIFVPRAEITDGGKRTLPLVIKKSHRDQKASDENSIISIISGSRNTKQPRSIRPATAKSRAQWQDLASPPKLIVRAQSNVSTALRHDH